MFSVREDKKAPFLRKGALRTYVYIRNVRTRACKCYLSAAGFFLIRSLLFSEDLSRGELLIDRSIHSIDSRDGEDKTVW